MFTYFLGNRFLFYWHTEQRLSIWCHIVVSDNSTNTYKSEIFAYLEKIDSQHRKPS